MTAPINVDSEFRSRRRQLRDALNQALASRDPILGFMLGLAVTLTIAAGVVAFFVARSGLP